MREGGLVFLGRGQKMLGHNDFLGGNESCLLCR